MLLQGALWNIVSCFFYGAYCIGLNCVVTEDFNYALFLGIMGTINCAWMTPTLGLLHLSGVAPFEMPSLHKLIAQFTYSLLVTGVFEFCWA